MQYGIAYNMASRYNYHYYCSTFPKARQILENKRLNSFKNVYSGIEFFSLTVWSIRFLRGYRVITYVTSLLNGLVHAYSCIEIGPTWPQSHAILDFKFAVCYHVFISPGNPCRSMMDFTRIGTTQGGCKKYKTDKLLFVLACRIDLLSRLHRKTLVLTGIVVNTLGPFCWHGFTLIPVRIINYYIYYSMWDGITYLSPTLTVQSLKFGNG